METEIQRFYRGKIVFLTGGSGFLGKVLIEKLLRVTEVERIYLLIRSKRGRNIDERIKDIFMDPLFAKLRQLQPHPAKRVTPIAGDCQLPQLGLSSEDRSTLIEHVDVVVHGAATVRFNEPMSQAVAINVRATLHLIELAKKMFNLKAFVHVSSAFANCTVPNIKEQFYTQNIGSTAEAVCKILDVLGEDTLNAQSDELCQEFPNTYCFTKALAEEAVLSHGSELPICIFRPGIVVPTCREPISGWIDNLYGPISILYGVASGVLHILYLKREANATLVPVDYCANMMLASAWNTAKSVQQIKPSPPPIYHLVPHNLNNLTWGDYLQVMELHGYKMPIMRMMWFPFYIATSSKLFYQLLVLLYHTIPGYIFDLLLMLRGKKRRLVQMYRKIHKQMKFLEYFVDRNWTFGISNHEQLWASMSETDQQLFNFNMLTINWSEYFYDSLWGMRRFIAKEEPASLPKAVQLMSRLLLLHRTMQLFVYGGGLTLMICTVLRMLHVM